MRWHTVPFRIGSSAVITRVARGRVLPYLTGRIEADLAHPFDRYLTNLYVDSVCYHIQALECCYGVMGADHILYGTDHPFGSHRIAAELVEQLAWSPADRELIYHGRR